MGPAHGTSDIRGMGRKKEKELVGARGFEPPTTRPPDECATRLRHAPTSAQCIANFRFREILLPKMAKRRIPRDLANDHRGN